MKGITWVGAWALIMLALIGTARADIVITEIMVDPLVASDANGQWFELYNSSAEAVDLSGWSFSDNDGQNYVVSSYTIEAGDYAVFGITTSTFYNGNTPVNLAYGSAITFDYSADELLIYDATSNLVDEVWYDESTWSYCEGASIQLSDPGLDNNDPSNWVISGFGWMTGNVDNGTPGVAFDGPYAIPAIVVSELLFHPNVASEANGEWFEIFNAGTESTDMRLWNFRDADNTGFRLEAHLIIEPGDFLVFAPTTSTFYNGGVPVDLQYGGAITFDNDQDELILYNPYGDVHDQVQYNVANGWPTASGASMQLTDLGADNDDPANWVISRNAWVGSAGDFGTPGEVFDGPYAPYDMVITELMYDPYVSSDENGEWFEITNAGSVPENLRLWEFFTSDNYFRVSGSIMVPAGESVVFAPTTSTFYNGGVAVDYAYGGALSFENEADQLKIVDPSGVVHDSIAYDEAGDWPQPFGASMQLNDINNENNDGTNWYASMWPWTGSAGDLGTPGEVNDGPYEDPHVIISEIMYNPLASSDDSGEWFELHNAGQDTINVKYWTMYDAGGQSFFPAAQLYIPPGEEVVLGRNGSMSYNGGIASMDYVFGGAMAFDNDADELFLTDLNGNAIDAVEYDLSSDWPDVEGASIYLPDVLADNNLASSWHIATLAWSGSYGDFGSPGEANQAVPGPYTFVISEIMINPVASSDDNGEWFELFNNGPEPVNLRLWEFYDNDGQSFIIPSDVFIGTNEYIVLGRNGSTFYNGGVTPMAYVYSGAMSFDNDADELIMKDIRNNIVDRVEWTTDVEWPHPEGASIYLLNPYEDNNVGTSWAISTEAWPGSYGDYGSPNESNVAGLLDVTPLVETIPAAGGTLTYDMHLISYLANSFENMAYTAKVMLPGGSPTIQLMNQYFTLPPFFNYSTQISHVVPPGAPAGEYLYSARVGYPTVYVSDSFTFTKLGSTGESWSLEDWTTSGFGIAEDLISSEPEAALPTVFAVGNAYPNPFNPSTSLDIDLPEAGEVEVAVYNVAGQLVATVTKGVYQAGYHTFSIDGSHWASGVYFVRATIPGQLTEMRKIVLMK